MQELLEIRLLGPFEVFVIRTRSRKRTLPCLRRASRVDDAWHWRLVKEDQIAHDEVQIRDFARGHTDAWCSHDPARIADHFVTGGTIAINGGEPTEVMGVARSFIDAFPDI
jgi:hypothetical protein